MERKLHARFEVSGSDINLCKCAYFIKKLYHDNRGPCGGSRLDVIFFILFFFFECFLIFFHFLEYNLRVDHGLIQPYKLIFRGRSLAHVPL